MENNQNNKYTEDSYGREALSAGFNLQSQFGENLTNRLRGIYSSVKSDMYTNTVDNELIMMGLQATGQDYSAYKPFLAEEKTSEILVSDRADYTFAENHNMFAQVYYRKISGDQVLGGTYSPNVSIFNVELQDNLVYGINNFSAGLSFGSVMYDIQNTGIDEDINFSKLDATETLYSFFVQDKISFTNWLSLTLGAKAETWTLVSNDPEISPSARILVKPQDDLMFWAAASRSITTPGYAQTRLERRMIRVPSEMLPAGSPAAYVAVVPGDNVNPTEYITFEFGGRTTIVPGLMIDASFFYSDIKGVIDLDNSAIADPTTMAKYIRPSDIYPTENLIVPLFYTNMEDVKSMGGEIILKANPIKNLKLELSYALYKYDTDNDNYVQESPENVIRFRPYYDIPSIGLNLSAQFVYASEYARGGAYNYMLQLDPRSANDDLIPNTRDTEAKSRIRLDINIEKEIMKDMLWLNVWGRNITNTDAYEDDYSKYYSVAYPQVSHATFGAGLRFSLK
jgi:outer membrane receptor protein involved in Fe transport